MKTVLFLQDLGLGRERTRQLLAAAGCGGHQPRWLGDAGLEAAEVEVAVTARHRVGPAELKPFPNLRGVSMAFTGYDEVDLAYCRERGLDLYYVPGYSTDSVAELAAGMAVALLRRLSVSRERLAAGSWDRAEDDALATVPGFQLRGRTVGIVGTGTIGMRVAELFHHGFRCPLVGWSRRRRPEFEEMGVYLETPEELFARADVVSLHLQLIGGSGGTVGFANRERMLLLRPGSILLNTARTGLVDLGALSVLLRERRFLGAGLDLTEEDDLRGHPELVELDNVVITPHVGFRTDRALANLAQITIENVGRLVRGDPTNRLDLDRLD